MQPTVEWGREESLTVADLPGMVPRLLASAAASGAANTGKDCRFWEYLEPLRLFASLHFPASLPWEVGSREHRLFLEGASQVVGLYKASRIWPSLPSKVAHDKLAIIL